MALLLDRVRRAAPQTYAWPALALLLVYLIAILLAPGASLTALLGAGLVFLASAAAATFAFWATRRMRNREAQRAWRYLSVALALRAAGDGFRLAVWLATMAPPRVPSLADLLIVAGYLSALAALARYPAAPLERFGRIRDLLDVTIAALSVLTLSWFIFIRPLILVALVDAIPIFWSAAWIVFDFLLFALAVRLSLLASERREVGVFRLIALSGLLLATSDALAGYFRLEGTQRLLGGRVELGWIAAGALLALASYRRMQLAHSGGERAEPEAPRRVARRLEPLLSVALTYAVVGFTALDWWFSGNLDWVGLSAAGLLVILLIARQGVIAGQIEMRQFAALVNSSADLAFICDAEGLIRLANPALRSAINLSAGAGLRAPLCEFLRSEPPCEQLLAQALEAGWSGEVQFRRRDGSSFPASLSLRPVWDERRSEPLLAATALDLTGIKARELEIRTALSEVAAARTELERLNVELEDKVEARTIELRETVADLARLNEELKDLDRLKSEFVALVSHELRAPLTNISTGIELILGANPGFETSVTRSLELVQEETRRLGQFVGTILDLSALEAGKFPIHSSDVPLRALAERALSRFPAHPGRRRIHLDIRDESLTAQADEGAVTSVLFHLLDNALKYAPEGRIQVVAEPDGESVRVEVIDEGPGIPTPQREHIFEMFHRLDARDSREVYGHGLGLHLSRRLVLAMGGDIRVEEAEGGGARFVFWLPRGQPLPES